MKTQPHLDMYNLIVRYYAINERMPIVRELAKLCRTKSLSTIVYRRKQLVAIGWIALEPTASARSMTLTRVTERGLSPAELRQLIKQEYY